MTVVPYLSDSAFGCSARGDCGTRGEMGKAQGDEKRRGWGVGKVSGDE
jgi:hypothetical protein